MNRLPASGKVIVTGRRGGEDPPPSTRVAVAYHGLIVDRRGSGRVYFRNCLLWLCPEVHVGFGAPEVLDGDWHGDGCCRLCRLRLNYVARGQCHGRNEEGSLVSHVFPFGLLHFRIRQLPRLAE